jgi:hypothetical protein
MVIPAEQLTELSELYPGLQQAVEAGATYFLIPSLGLPPGCSEPSVDALLCPTSREGYESRLFLAKPITSNTSRNWNASSVRILERNWHAVSWKTQAGLRLAQMVSAHLTAFR